MPFQGLQREPCCRKQLQMKARLVVNSRNTSSQQEGVGNISYLMRTCTWNAQRNLDEFFQQPRVRHVLSFVFTGLNASFSTPTPGITFAYRIQGGELICRGADWAQALEPSGLLVGRCAHAAQMECHAQKSFSFVLFVLWSRMECFNGEFPKIRGPNVDPK